MLKKIMIGLGLIIVAVAVGIYYLSQNAGPMIKSVIETQGSRATQVDVSLDSVDINMIDLKAGLRGLTVGNPAGFKTDRAISLGEISVKISEDWSTKLIVIEEVMVNAPEITYEIGSAGSNIAAIQENVENFMKVVAGGESSASSDTSASSGEGGPKIIINDFYIKNGKVNVSASLLEGKTMATPLPEIHLEDIGKEENGASPAEVVEQVIAAITAKASSAAGSLDLSQLGLADISGKASEAGKKAQDAVKGVTDTLGSGASGAGSSAKDAADGVGNAVKGLFGN